MMYLNSFNLRRRCWVVSQYNLHCRSRLFCISMNYAYCRTPLLDCILKQSSLDATIVLFWLELTKWRELLLSENYTRWTVVIFRRRGNHYIAFFSCVIIGVEGSVFNFGILSCKVPNITDNILLTRYKYNLKGPPTWSLKVRSFHLALFQFSHSCLFNKIIIFHLICNILQELCHSGISLRSCVVSFSFVCKYPLNYLILLFVNCS